MYIITITNTNINQANLDMPGTGPGHARTWTWTCQDLDLDMPGPGPGHAMSWTSSTYIINLHHQLTSFIEYFTQTLLTIDPPETTLACGDFNINLLSLNSNDHCNTYLEGTLSSGFLPAIDSFLWR